MSTPSPIPLKSRPLSPHLQVYRLQLTSMLSFLHRFTGIVLTMGTIPLVVWLGAIAMGPVAYQIISDCYASPLGILMLLGWVFCFYFHLINGVRHLFWDMGWGFEIETVYRSGWTVLLMSMGLTLLTFWWVFWS